MNNLVNDVSVVNDLLKMGIKFVNTIAFLIFLDKVVGKPYLLRKIMIAVLLSSLAFAFQPSNTSFIGKEPNRLQHFDPGIQHQLRQQESWQAFLKENPTWQARFDQKTFLPYRAWGKGIAFDVSAADTLEAELREWIDGQDVFGVKSSSLRIRDIAHDETNRRWYVHFDQVQKLSQPVYNAQSEEIIHEVTFWRSGVDARIFQDKLTQFTAQTHPIVRTDWDIRVDAIAALNIAQAEGPAPAGFHVNKDADLVILPWEEAGLLHYKLCWQVSSETQMPRGKWISFVDAESGELLNVYNEVRFLEGILHAEHDTRTLDGDFSVSPLERLNIDGSAVRTAQDGSYSLETEETEIVIGFEGRRVKVLNDTGPEAEITLVGGEFMVTDEHAHQAEIDQYIFLTHITNWSERYSPQITNQWTQITSNVNLDETCNAHFDGEVNFYRAGNGCNNTGRIADVAYHEWGHGFHYYNLLSGEYDGSISEGVGDSIAFLQTEDYRISPYFGTNGYYIREVSTNYSYPDDIVGEVHQDGLIFAGAVWDLWSILKDELGEEEAYETAVSIFVSGMRAGPTIPQAFDEFVFADDDNGDLSDGTPNLCSLVDAFGQHGLGFNGGSSLFSLGHTPIGNQLEAAEGFPIVADIEIFAEQCLSSSLDVSTLYYSIDGGASWDTTELDVTADTVEGFIPPAISGTEILYYIGIEDSDGNGLTIPAGGAINPYSFYVGELEEIYCTDFEADDGNFTHSLLAGEEQEGADDWLWGTPTGLGGDPSFAASGSKVWGNDLGGEINGQSYNGEYQNEKHNQLLSDTYDISEYETVVLSYDRWLTVEDGFYDHAIITANGAEIWTNHDSSAGDEHHTDVQWQNHSLSIPTAGETTMQIGWEIDSDQGLSMGGWNIDNFCLYGVVVPDEGSENLDNEEGWMKAGCSSVTASDYWLWSLGLGMLFVGSRRRR